MTRFLVSLVAGGTALVGCGATAHPQVATTQAARIPIGNAAISSAGFPGQKRADTSKLVVYQVWLNYYAKNPADDQPSVSVLSNAAARLPSLASMGVTMVQLSPFQPFLGDTTPDDITHPPGQSPYNSLDYYDVAPGYSGFPYPERDPGTRDQRIAALAGYIAQAHRLGIKVIMDCVFHSTDPKNVLVLEHPDYYEHKANGGFVVNKYNMYELNYRNPGTVSYMVNMVKYWRATAGIDGCRSDAAAFVPLSFWAMLNNEMKKIDPSWFQVAEVENADVATYAGTYSGPVYNPGEVYHDVYGFDAVYGVTWMVGLRAVLDGKAGAVGGAAALATAWRYPEFYPYKNRSPVPAGTAFFRSVDNQDQYPRAPALAAGNVGVLAATALDVTMDGIPFFYDGQEIGDIASTSVAYQTFISWAAPPHPEDTGIVTQLISLRAHHPALQAGSTTWYTTSDPADVVAYARQGSGEDIVVVINLSAQQRTATVTGAGMPVSMTDLSSGQVYAAAGGRWSLLLAPYSYVIACSSCGA